MFITTSSGAVININLKATIAVIDTSVRGKIKSTKSRAVILIEITQNVHYPSWELLCKVCNLLFKYVMVFYNLNKEPKMCKKSIKTS